MLDLCHFLMPLRCRRCCLALARLISRARAGTRAPRRSCSTSVLWALAHRRRRGPNARLQSAQDRIQSTAEHFRSWGNAPQEAQRTSLALMSPSMYMGLQTNRVRQRRIQKERGTRTAQSRPPLHQSLRRTMANPCPNHISPPKETAATHSRRRRRCLAAPPHSAQKCRPALCHAPRARETRPAGEAPSTQPGCASRAGRSARAPAGSLSERAGWALEESQRGRGVVATLTGGAAHTNSW